MWLSWGSASRVGELAIRKIIVCKANEDCMISIDELSVVLNILLVMEVEELVTLRRSLPILLLVLNVLTLLLTSAAPLRWISLWAVHTVEARSASSSVGFAKRACQSCCSYLRRADSP
jgi:hypothetical protein